MATTTEAAGGGMERVAGELKRPYVLVFVFLGLVTAFEVQVPTLFTNWGIGASWQILFLIGSAIIKAAMVALYYMHLRYEPRILRLLPVAPLAFVIFLAVVIMASSVR